MLVIRTTAKATVHRRSQDLPSWGANLILNTCKVLYPIRSQNVSHRFCHSRTVGSANQVTRSLKSLPDLLELRTPHLRQIWKLGVEQRFLLHAAPASKKQFTSSDGLYHRNCAQCPADKQFIPPPRRAGDIGAPLSRVRQFGWERALPWAPPSTRGSMNFVTGKSRRLEAPEAAVSCIRVVLLEHDQGAQRRLEQLISDERLFCIVASADSWHHCEALLDEFAPELLISGAGLLPPNMAVPQGGFPIILQLGEKCSECPLAIGSPECPHLRRMLNQIADEVYVRKANQLSELLQQYLVGLTGAGYLTSLKINHAGASRDVPVQHVAMLEAAGNYVRVHMQNGVFELRETISGLSSKLDPEIFIRIHRSYIVNINYVVQLSRSDGVPSHLILSNGQVVPVGPSYREEVAQIFDEARRLIA